MATKIRKEQINTEEFIQKSTDTVNWNSDFLTASAKAILSKIEEAIAGGVGAMQFRGDWTLASSDSIKKGYVYVYSGSSTGTIGDVTLENGDTLIAKLDNASLTNPAHWTIVNVNITGAVTEANFFDKLSDSISNGNGNSLGIDLVDDDPDAPGPLLRFTVKFPTVSNGAVQEGKYISGLSISAATGQISLVRGDLPVGANHMLFDEIPSGSVNGSNRVFVTSLVAYSLSHCALYINGVRQHAGSSNDYTVAYESSSSHKLKFTINSTAYIPKTGDVVTCDYLAKEPLD